MQRAGLLHGTPCPCPMSLREITSTEDSVVTKTHRMMRLIVTDESQIFAVWSIDLGNGKRAERSVAVSPELNADAKANEIIRTLVDSIRDDTFPRTGAPK